MAADSGGVVGDILAQDVVRDRRVLLLRPPSPLSLERDRKSNNQDTHSANASDHPSPKPWASSVTRQLARDTSAENQTLRAMHVRCSTTASQPVRDTVRVLVHNDVVLKCTVAERVGESPKEHPHTSRLTTGQKHQLICHSVYSATALTPGASRSQLHMFSISTFPAHAASLPAP